MALISKAELVRATIFGGFGGGAIAFLALTNEPGFVDPVSLVAGGWLGFIMVCAFMLIKNVRAAHRDRPE